MTVYTTTATGTDSTNNSVVLGTTANMAIGLAITFSGTTFGGIVSGNTYYIRSIESGTQITLSGTAGGAIFDLSTATGSMTATFSSGGQQIISTVPPGEPLNQAFNQINVNFDQLFAAGPVLSNIQITDNTIRTLDTNGNLVLAPNGIGNVVSNVSIIPNTANIRNLGSPTARWSTVYTQYLDISGNITFANVTLTGNLRAQNITANANLNAAIVNTSNIVGNAITITATTGNIVFDTVGNIDVGNTWINNVADPIQAQDAATKFYVDAVAQGLDPKASVVLASKVALPAYTYNNGSSGVGATLTGQTNGVLSLDGVDVAVDQRVLIKNETGAYVDDTTMSAAFNGIYVVVDPGSVTDPFVLIRTADFDVGTEIPGAYTFVETGDTQADTGWVCTTNNPIVVGTTQIVWTQFSGAGTYTAGNGLSLLGTQFNVNVDPETIEINGSNQVAVKASANLVTPNIGNATGSSLSVTGNITANNVQASQNITANGTAYLYDISSTGTASLTTVNATTISASGNITGNNITAIGDLVANNLLTSGVVSAAGNITGGNISISGVGGNLTLTGGNISGANVVSANVISVTGNATVGNISATNFTGATVSVTGNITAANINGNITGNIVGPIPASINILYVAKNGSDSNDGSLNSPFLTIKAAMAVATAGTSVHVAPGAYTEINPITIPTNVALMGDNLRSVFVIPATPASDLFYMRGGTYVWGITIRNYLANGFSYDPATPEQNVFVSPYIQNITSSTTTGTAVFIDGNATSAISTKAMILGFFTIINRGGKGVYLVNSAYSQAVNIYTIACDVGLKVESGSFVTLNGSDCSIGNYGLIADGVGPLQTSGNTVGYSIQGVFVLNGLTNGQPHVNTVMKIAGDPEYYTIDIILPNIPATGDSTVYVQQTYTANLAPNTNVEFYTRSSIIASAHTFEYVGAGTNPATALPQYGGIPIEANEVLQLNGGVVTYTSTDQKGNFKVGNGFIVNQATGTITGDAFYKSLFAQMTPYILALGP